MIVRLMGEGQFRIPDELAAELNALDDRTAAALEAGDEETMRSLLRQMWELVERRGSRVPDEELHASDAIVPPDDLSLDEARELLTGEGLIPDIP